MTDSLALDSPPSPRLSARTVRGDTGLLLLASWSFLLLIGLMLVSIAAAGFPSAEPVTHAELDPIRGLRIAVAWALLLPVTLSGIGAIRLARHLTASTRASIVLASLSVAAMVATAAYAVAWTVGYSSFTTPTIIEDPTYVWALVLCRHLAVPLTLLAAAALALIVRSAGGARRTMLVLACGAIAVAGVFAVTGGEFVPPAIVVAVWSPCAVVARRLGRRADRARIGASADSDEARRE